MPVEHLPADTSPERVTEALARDACVIVDKLASPERLKTLHEELAPWIESRRAGVDEFSGHSTKRIGGLIGRSPACRELVTDPLALGAVKQVLSHATSFQLHLTQVIAIGPGETAQDIHRDQWAFDFFPFPKGYEVQCNTIWALTDFTEENGATRVIPGSHQLEDKQRFKVDDTEVAEMEAGSTLFYTGALYHGGGANRSSLTRIGINITYNVSWLRQEENQYLSVPFEVARTLPDDLLRLMGYARGAYALGYVDDLRDPLTVLKKDAGDDRFGDLERVREQLQSK
jgi:ectoine hydroxylase-related dioxygenase (phytanoyl-CoA dioxygenase family)